MVTFCEGSKQEVIAKYPSTAAKNIKELEDKGIELYYGVLPHMLGMCSPLGKNFDSIIFFNTGVDLNRVDRLKENKGEQQTLTKLR